MSSANMQILRSNFSQRFLKRLESQSLSQTGDVADTVSQGITDSVVLNESDFGKAISNGVLNASRISGVAAGATLALGIASQVGQGLEFDSSREQLRSEVRDSWVGTVTEPELASTWSEILSRSTLEDPQLICVENGGNSPIALMGDVYFPQDAARQFSDPGERHFVLGHELGHLENGDSKTQIGFKFLLQSLDESPQANTVEFGVLRRELDVQIEAENHRQEFRADKRGLEIAMSMGHAPGPTVAFLEGLPRSTTHPSGNERITALVS